MLFIKLACGIWVLCHCRSILLVVWVDTREKLASDDVVGSIGPLGLFVLDGIHRNSLKELHLSCDA